jgi:DNA mismatch endonuclease (patch repair protein)
MDKLTPERRSANMSRIRSKNSGPELKVRKLLYRMGYRYRLHLSSLPGRPDIVFPKLRKVLFVHGCFWHCHKGCVDSHVPKSAVNYWEPKLARNVARDEEHERKLVSEGWRVLVLWECEVADIDSHFPRIREFLGEPRSNVLKNVGLVSARALS